LDGRFARTAVDSTAAWLQKWHREGRTAGHQFGGRMDRRRVSDGEETHLSMNRRRFQSVSFALLAVIGRVESSGFRQK
jgi:hypothetical protein